jgi:hypothetical protein
MAKEWVTTSYTHAVRDLATRARKEGHDQVAEKIERSWSSIEAIMIFREQYRGKIGVWIKTPWVEWRHIDK